MVRCPILVMKIIPQADKTCALINETLLPEQNPLSGIHSLTNTMTGEIIELGGIIHCNGEPMRVNQIKQVNNANLTLWKVYHMSRRGTYYMMLPLLLDSSFNRQRMGIEQIVASAFYNYKQDPADHSIFLLVRSLQQEKFFRIQRAMQAHPRYRDHFGVGDLYDLYRFEVPDYHKDDHDKFVAGKYSELSEVLQSKCLAFITSNNLKALTIQRFNKDPQLRRQIEEIIDSDIDPDAELIPPPDESEIFDLERDAVYTGYPEISPKEAFDPTSTDSLYPARKSQGPSEADSSSRSD